VRILAGLFIALCCGTFAAAAPPAAHHPILGTWKLKLPDIDCTEIYRFRSNGTTLVTSADEVTETEFEISADPSSKGYYQLADTIVKDNGARDCSGEKMAIGNKVTVFVRFAPSQDSFLMCKTEALDACIGQFFRVPSQDI
jgi:hypothetical protein